MSNRPIHRHHFLKMQALVTLAIMLANSLSSYSQNAAALASEPVDEYKVKAAFIYKFSGYIKWPKERTSEAEKFVVGVLGGDPFDGALAQLFEGKRVGDLPVELRKLDGADELPECHLVFVNKTATDIEAIVAKAYKHAVVLIGDGPDLAEIGCTFGFYIEENKVRFAVNMRAVRASAIEVSSKLLQVAKVIREEEEGQAEKPR